MRCEIYSRWHLVEGINDYDNNEMYDDDDDDDVDGGGDACRLARVACSAV